jgi:DNA modification methylase
MGPLVFLEAPKEMTPDLDRIYVGDCLDVLRSWPDAFIQTCVTSPPYWGLRDYGVAGQLGLEKTPEEYVAKMVEVFRQIRRVLRTDGTLWLTLGDSFNANGRQGHGTRTGYKQATNRASAAGIDNNRLSDVLLKAKNQLFMPHRVAQALQADGWYARQTIIWSKPNSMPESVTDRPSTAHEYIFLMSKSERYFYDNDAIKEPASEVSMARMDRAHSGYAPPGQTAHRGQARGPRHHRDKQRGHGRRHAGFNDRWDAMEKAEQCSGMRNKRSVWTIATCPFSEAHFATFPPELIKPCILAGAPLGGVVLDPFMGAGTTALVAAQYSRHFLGIELNPGYAAIAERRIASEKAQLKFI